MAFTLAEGLVEALADYIEANLAAKLNALDTEYGDGITLEDIVATYKGLKSLESIPDYPVLYVISPAARIESWQAAGSSGVIESKPEVVMGIVALDRDGEMLQKRLYRYGRALVELMIEGLGNSAIGGWALGSGEGWELNMESARFENETGTSLSPFIGEVSLALRGNRIESK